MKFFPDYYVSCKYTQLGQNNLDKESMINSAGITKVVTKNLKGEKVEGFEW
jgi:hypothetical protein